MAEVFSAAPKQPRRPAPRVVGCEAYGPVEIPLEEVLESSGRLRLNPDIENGDYFAVTLKSGSLTLRARGFVGYIPLNDDLVVYVRPRVPVSNLARLVTLSGEPPTALTSLRSYAPAEEWSDSLLDIYTGTLIGHVETIFSSGLMREYTRREEVSSFPRGRILLQPTIQRQYPRGIHHAAHVAWFERDADIAVNRCLKYAIWMLARRYMQLPDKTREQRTLHRGLNGLFPAFGGVELDHSRQFMEDPMVQGRRKLPTLRAYYRDALSVAAAIIEQRSVLIDSPGGSVRLPSIVINMNYVFEAYVRNVLHIHAETNDWPVEVLNGNEEGRKDLFNRKPSEAATPDIVLKAGDATPLVIEVKNVPVREFFSERDAIAQSVTYALSYRAKRVVIVHPRRSRYQLAGLSLQGIVNDVEVHQYRFDLGAADLEVEDARFGEAIGGLVALQ